MKMHMGRYTTIEPILDPFNSMICEEASMCVCACVCMCVHVCFMCVLCVCVCVHGERLHITEKENLYLGILECIHTHAYP